MRAPTLVLIGLAMTTITLAQEPPAASPAPAPAPAAAPAPTAAPLAVPAAPKVESIKILIDDKAKSDGELRFEFTATGQAAKTIRVTIAKKMKGDDVARDLEKEFKVALGPDYKVDRYDPDKVKIEAKKKDATFTLTMSALTASGISVRLK